MFVDIFQISGALAAASIFQVFMGASGLIGFLMRFVGPLTVCPTVALLGIMLYDGAIEPCKHHWGVGVL